MNQIFRHKHRTNSLGRTRWRGIPFFACIAVLLAFFSPLPASAALPTGFQEYYVLGYEEHAWRAFLEINDNPDPAGLRAGRICSTVSLVATADHQIVYYDHWEDGYEADLIHHIQSTTEVYGDGDSSNGGNGGDILTAGNAINLASDRDITGSDVITGYVSVNPARDPDDLRYDGGDRIITSGGPVNLTHAMWPLNNSWAGGAWEVYSRQAYADAYSYRLPVGEDLYGLGGGDDGAYGDFRNVYLQLGAFEDNTTVLVSNDTGTINLTLDRGQTYSSMGYIDSAEAPTITLKAGTVIRTNKPIQAGLMTGADSSFQGRFLIILPDQLWGADYVVPVPSGGSRNEAEVYLTNPNDFEISINAYDMETQTSFVVSPTGHFSATVPYSLKRGGAGYVPQGSATRFTSSDGVFGVVVCADTSDTDYDWGFSGIPAKYLARDYYASWSPGNSCTPPNNPDCDGEPYIPGLQPAVNGSPVWVTPLADDTTFYADFSPLDDVVDETFTLDVLQQRRIFDPDKDNTGMHIWASGEFAIVWGEDPATAGDTTPYLDLGFSMLPPFQRWLEPVMTLDKTATPTTLSPPGGTVTFTLVTQSYNDPLTHVDISDTLPVGWTYVPGSTHVTYPDRSTVHLAPTIDGRELLWDLSTDLEPNEGLMLTFQAQITNTDGVSISINQGEAIGRHGYFGNLFNPRDEATVYVSTLNLTKSVSSAEAGIGDTLVYTISYTNVSSSTTATNVVLYDVVPIQHVTFQSASGGYSYNPASGTIAWTLSSLAPQDSGAVTLTVTVNDFVEDGTVIENVGYISSDQTKTGSNSAHTTVLVPDVRFRKSGPTAAMTEQLVTYTLSYENVGGAPATGVTIRDIIPVSTTYVSGSLTINTGNGWIPLTDPQRGAYVSPTLVITPGITPGIIAAGETGQVRFRVRVDADVPLGSRIMNWAALDRDLDIPRDSNLVVTRIADLLVKKGADTLVGGSVATPGSLITYTLVYVNHSNTNPQTNVYLREAIPDYTTFVTASGTVSYSWDYGATWSSTRPVTAPVTHVRWHDSLLPAATARAVYLAVQVSDALPANTTIQNIAHITSTETASYIGEWIPSNQVEVETVDLWVEKEVSRTSAQVGDLISYTISCGNRGSADALGVQVLDTIPTGGTYVAGSIWGAGADDGGNPILTWDVMTVTAGASGQAGGFAVALNDNLLPGTAVTNTSILSSAYGLEASDWVTVIITSSANLTVTKSGNPSTVDVGETVTYTIAVSNVGQGYATDVLISDTLPSGTQFISNSITLAPYNAGITGTAPPILASDVTITAGHRVTVTFGVTVTGPLADGAWMQSAHVITNTTHVTSPHEPAPVTSIATTTVHSPVFTLTKQSGSNWAKQDPTSPVIVGAPLTYTLTVTNTGQGGATNVVVSDTLPAGANYISGGLFTSSSNSVSWIIPAIPAGDSQQVTFVVSTCRTSLVNTAYRVVTSTQKVASPPGSPLLTILNPPTMEAGFDHDPSNVTVGDTVHFTSTGTSNGSPIADWTWDFGDPSAGSGQGGNTAKGSTASHVYSNPGVYTVTLIMTDTCGYTDAATETVPVHVPDLGAVKSAEPPIVDVNGMLTYTIAVSNIGQGRATDVLISDTVPVSTVLIAATTPYTGPMNGVITWSLGTLDAGVTRSVTMVVHVDSSAVSGTVIANTAWVTSAQGVTSTDTVTTPVRTATDLTVTKSDSPDPVGLGATLTYTLVYANAGSLDAQDVYITDTLPVGVTYGGVVDVTPSFFGPSTMTLPYLTWYTPTLMAGVSGAIVFTVTVDAGASGTLTNSVIITSTTTDSTPGNNRADEPTSVIPQVDFASATYAVGESDGAAIITVTLGHPSSFPATVDYQTTTGGTATPGNDYTATDGTLSFPPLSTVQTFTVPILPDLLTEPDETVVLILTGATSATVGTAHNPATLVIGDDDPVATATLSGTVFVDVNGNGIQDAGELGIPDVLITSSSAALDTASGATLTPLHVSGDAVLTATATAITTTTDLSGSYSFSTTVAGVYVITETEPNGYFSTTPNEVHVDVIPGNVYQVNFGDAPVSSAFATIYGTVFNDDNNSRLQDEDETGIPGATITLDGGVYGPLSHAVTTGPYGGYTFSATVPGTYAVTETDLTNYTSTTPNEMTVYVILDNGYQVDFGDMETCLGDHYEDDDTWNQARQAKPFPVGRIQAHQFCDDAIDWVWFPARAHSVYTITTRGLGDRADTILALFDTDGQTLLAINDDNPEKKDRSSRIVWKAPANGDYYVRITNKNALVGPNTYYELRIRSNDPLYFYLPIVMRYSR